RRDRALAGARATQRDALARPFRVRRVTVVGAEAIEEVAVLEVVLAEDGAGEAAGKQRLTDGDRFVAREPFIRDEPIDGFRADEAARVRAQQMTTIGDRDALRAAHALDERGEACVVPRLRSVVVV